MPIPGTKRRHYLEENLGAAGLALDANDLTALDAAMPRKSTAGPRYGASGLAMLEH